MNGVFFEITWMAKCMCMAYLGKAWQQGALWEGVWWFGDFFDRKMVLLLRTYQPTTALSFFTGFVHDLHERGFMFASFSRIMHHAHSKNGSVMVKSTTTHLKWFFWPSIRPQITNLRVRQTPLFRGQILEDLRGSANVLVLGGSGPAKLNRGRSWFCWFLQAGLLLCIC